MRRIANSIPGKYFTFIFWMLISVSMIQFLVFKYVVSLDGPQHLHNAYVLKDMILNKGNVRDFYNINPLPVAYWTSHSLLTLFTFILRPWLAEKLLLLTYVAGIALAFRYFLQSVNKAFNPIGVYLIFPFIPSLFLLHGYYAFSYGVIMLLITLGYWNKIGPDPKRINLVKFSLLLLLFYFTHGLVFTFFLGVFLIQFIYESGLLLMEGRGTREDLLKIRSRIIKVIVVFIPVLIILYLYSRSIISGRIDAKGGPLIIKDQLLHLFRITPIIGFNREMESVFTKPLSVVLALVWLSIIVGQIVSLASGKTTFRLILKEKTNLYLLISLGSLFIFILNPDRFVAGSITQRIGYFFFLFLIMWIPFQHIPAWLNLTLGAVILFAVIYNQTLMPKIYKPPVKIISEIQELDQCINENASILTLKGSDSWLLGHFGLYVGLQKHIVNLNNPQCYGPFPLVWDQKNSSALFAGDKQINVSGLGRVDPEKHPSGQLDYIVVFMYDAFMNNESNAEWIEILEKDYQFLKLTSNRSAGLYRSVQNWK